MIPFLRLAAIGLVLALAGPAFARQPGPPSAAAAAARKADHAQRMAALAFLHGSWKGDGWMAFGPNRRETFAQTERIGPFLDGDVLLIEGTGLAGDAASRPVHHAFAVISPAENGDGYEFRSYANQRAGTFAARLVRPGALEWSLTTPGGEIRYLIAVEGDTWRETGERSGDGGKTWTPFFEMNLRRAGPASW